MFSDAEIGMKLAFDRNLSATVTEAQMIIDRKQVEVDALTRALNQTREELKRERARRLIAQIRLEDLVDPPR